MDTLLGFFLNRSFLDIEEKNPKPFFFKLEMFLPFLYNNLSGYKYKIRLVSILRKRDVHRNCVWKPYIKHNGNHWILLSDIIPKSSRYMCPVCGKRLSKIQEHMRRIHPDFNYDPANIQVRCWESFGEFKGVQMSLWECWRVRRV